MPAGKISPRKSIVHFIYFGFFLKASSMLTAKISSESVVKHDLFLCGGTTVMVGELNFLN